MGDVWFEVLSDFWPHGGVADEYGLLRSDGTSERALVFIDRDGIISGIHVSDINVRPPLELIAAELKKNELNGRSCPSLRFIREDIIGRCCQNVLFRSRVPALRGQFGSIFDAEFLFDAVPIGPDCLDTQIHPRGRSPWWQVQSR